MTTASDAVGREARRQPGETLFSWSVFPVAMFGSLAISIAIFGAGGSVLAAFGAGMAFGYAVVVLGERLFPFVPDWNRSHGDIGTDAA